MQLVFEFKSYWLAGTGNDAGAYADNLAVKNNHALPYLPARTQKGQIRDAFLSAENNGWFSEFNKQFKTKLTNVLFGIESRNGKSGQGVLQFSNAEMCENEIAFFLEPVDPHESAQRKRCLFTLLNSTAIDDQGKAKPYSLRSNEVVVPITLYGTLTTQTLHLEPILRKTVDENLSNWFEQVLPLVTHIGAQKHRGLGEVIVDLVQGKEKTI